MKTSVDPNTEGSSTKFTKQTILKICLDSLKLKVKEITLKNSNNNTKQWIRHERGEQTIATQLRW